LIIFDEAHFITSWTDTKNISEFLTNNDICNYRLFGSATPTEDIELQPLLYGKIVEKVKVYELINQELLCNIVTIIKQLNENKSEYHNLKNLIVESMTKYNKKKGIIYVNNCINAENLYKLLQKQGKLNVYISKNIEVKNDNDTNIKTFENDKEQCIIICVGMINYGYDCPYIDLKKWIHIYNINMSKEKIKYDINYLNSYCKANNIILIDNIININKDTIINAKCLECNNIVEKKFRLIINSGCYCKKCTSKNREDKRKQTCLNKYGVENPFQNNQIKEKIKETNIIKYGVEYPSQNENIKEQKKQTCLKNYDVENPSQNESIKEQKKQTCLKNHGVEHPSQNESIKEQMKKTCLKNHGVEYSSQNESIKEQKKQTCLKKYGVEYPLQNEEIKNKSKQSCLKNYGVEYPLQNNQIKNKTKQTCLINLGVENPSQNVQIKERKKQTCLMNLGVEYPFQNEGIKNKSKQTCLKNHGVEHPSQNENIKEQKKQTNIKKYGTEFTFQNEEIKNKSKQKCLIKYGVEYPMQNSIIADKSLKKSYSKKLFIFPSGKEISCQGYEPFALKELLSNYNETDIIIGCTNVPKIYYIDENNKKHIHFVDIFIPSENKCIEVKSQWTLSKKNVFEKQIAGKENGLNYEIWVFNSKGVKNNCYK